MDDGPQLVLLFGVTCLTIASVHTFLLPFGVGVVFGMGLLAIVVAVYLDFTDTGEAPQVERIGCPACGAPNTPDSETCRHCERQL